MKYLIFIVLAFCSSCFASEMNNTTSYYSFAVQAIDSFGGSISKCDSYALEDPTTEWLCGSYNQGHEDFMSDVELFIEPINNINAHSDWLVFYNDDDTIDFYGKTYKLDDSKILIAYDPSEVGREIFIGVSPNIFSISKLGSVYNSNSFDNLFNNPSNTHSKLNYDCKDFTTQAEAIQFFKSNGFSSDYDPYNLDADNNGIPCEVPKKITTNNSICSSNEYWVSSYVKKNGTKVKGHCRKKR